MFAFWLKIWLSTLCGRSHYIETLLLPPRSDTTRMHPHTHAHAHAQAQHSKCNVCNSIDLVCHAHNSIYCAVALLGGWMNGNRTICSYSFARRSPSFHFV